MKGTVRIHTFDHALTRTGHRLVEVEPGLAVRSLVDLAWDRLLADRAGRARSSRVVVLNGTPLRDGTPEGDAALDRIAVAGDEIHVAPAEPNWETAILIAIALTSAVLSFVLTPRLGLAEQPSDNAESRFSFGRYSRTAVRGEPIPVFFGRHQRYGGVRVSELPGDGEDGDKMVRLLIDLGEGPVHKVGNRAAVCDRLQPPAISGIYLNDQPIENFPGARISVRMGADNQAMIPGFVDSEVLREVGAGTNGAVLANTSGLERTGGGASGEAVTYSTFDPVDAVTVRVNFPTGLFTLSGGGQILARRLKWRYRSRASVGPGAWSAWTVQTIEKAERSAFVQAVRVDGLSGGGAPARFDVQVERVSVEAAGAGVSYADEIRFDSVVETRYEQNRYTNNALLAIELDASQQISSVPRVSATVEGYADLRIWDGVSDPASPTFVRGYSNNPAWIALELLTNTRWGMGEPDDRIDLAGLIECAQNVPTWKDAAGVEHPFECNIVLDDAKDPIDWLRDVCACMRVVPVPASKWMFVQQRPRLTAVETFGDGSIARDDSGELAMTVGYPDVTGGRTSPNQIRMTFKNADNAGEPDLVVFPDAGELWLGGMTPEQANPKTGKFNGEMPEGQAMAEAIYEAKRIRARRTTIDLVSTRQVVVCQPEERIDVACSVSGWGVSGRVLLSPPGTSLQIVRLDRTIEIEEGREYAIRIVHLDASIETRAVAMDPGVYAAGEPIGLATELAAAAEEGAEYALGVSGIEVKPFLVESVRATRSGDAGADYRWSVKAGEYNAAVFDVTPADVPVIVYTNLGGERTAPGPVQDLVATHRTVNGKLILELSWTQTAADAAHTASFIVYRRQTGTETFVAVPGITAGRTHVDVTLVDLNIPYDYIVVARSPLGAQLSPYDPRHPIVSVAFGLGADPPGAPGGPTLTQVAGNVYTFSWDPVEGAASYQVLACGDTGTGTPNDGAEDCLVLARTSSTSMEVTLPAGESCTLYVRSCTEAGRLSWTASSATDASPDAPVGESIKDTHAVDFAGAEGTFTNCAWDGGSSRVLVTDATDPAGGVWESGSIDTGANTATEICLRPATSNACEDPDIDDADFLEFPSIEADQWGVVSGSGTTAVVGMLMPPFPDDQQSWRFEVRTSTDNVTFTDYTPLAFGAALSGTFRFYQVRATMKRRTATRPYTPALRGLTIVCTN